MNFYNLDLLIPGLTIDFTWDDIDRMAKVFYQDFVDNPLKIRDLKVKVITAQANHLEFDGYPETFVHLITRKNNTNRRVFDPFRANKIHWIKPILLNHNQNEIKFFKYKEGSGRIRDYYWFKDGDFLVIMEKITPDYLIITSFNIDNRRNRKHYEKRYLNYIDPK